jgi:hypothetical protein
VINRDLVINRKKTDRLYKAEELALRRRRSSVRAVGHTLCELDQTPHAIAMLVS